MRGLWLTRVLRFARWGIVAVLALVIVAAGVGYGLLRASLPRLEGGGAMAGLRREVIVRRDRLGVAVIEGGDRTDVARALGFVHAQERFFQMDLLRRRGAGELSALVGAAALEVDRGARVHRFRHRARQVLARTPPAERVVLAGYTAGVNQGLAELGARPFEYFLLRQRPEPWREEDTFLVVYAMYFTLQDADGEAERGRALLRHRLPPALYTLVTAPGSARDAPLFGEPLPTPPLPGPAEVAGWRPLLERAGEILPDDEAFPGSNNWAVAGRHSKTGAALLASDMHLQLGVPNIWFRAQLRYGTGASAEARGAAGAGADTGGGVDGSIVVTGVTLPGAPLVVAGSNGHVAWGFTNAYGDFSDVVVLEQPRPGWYRTPEGEREIDRVAERIEVAGGAAVSLTVEETIWGPVVGRDEQGRACAYRWVAHDPDQAMNVGLLALERARGVAEALPLAARVRLPAQNVVMAGAAGDIGWTLGGAIPRRVGGDGQLPRSWADGAHRWDGYLAPEAYPHVLNPPSGRIWTANNRVTSGGALAQLGDGGYDNGARAQQIRDALLARPSADEKDLLAIQLDDRALFLAPWHRHLTALLDDAAAAERPVRRAFREELQRWSGRATTDSVAYRLVRGYRWLFTEALHRAWLTTPPSGSGAGGLASPELLRRLREGVGNHADGYLLRVIAERPAQLLPGPYRDWRAFELAVVDELIDRLAAGGGPLRARTWGERNTARIRHPLSASIPLLGQLLDAPAEPLPGDSNLPRVQGRSFGASERMVVSPGHEGSGIFHMPGGQSGHPLSPFYLAGHDDWASGRPAPFLPGPALHTLRFTPSP